MRILKLDFIWKKYKYAVIIVLAGVLLMLLPRWGNGASVQETTQTLYDTQLYSLDETETKMEEIIAHIDGVGRVRIMLTISSGPQLQLAADTDQTGGDGDTRSRRETVTVNRGSGYQEVVITRQLCPVYQGAVVVCQGAGNASVRLAVIEAVSALTGLNSDKISVVKWKQS